MIVLVLVRSTIFWCTGALPAEATSRVATETGGANSNAPAVRAPATATRATRRPLRRILQQVQERVWVHAALAGYRHRFGMNVVVDWVDSVIDKHISKRVVPQVMSGSRHVEKQRRIDPAADRTHHVCTWIAFPDTVVHLLHHDVTIGDLVESVHHHHCRRAVTHTANPAEADDPRDRHRVGQAAGFDDDITEVVDHHADSGTRGPKHMVEQTRLARTKIAGEGDDRNRLASPSSGRE